MPRSKTNIRVEFTPDHDRFLIKYLATYCPTKQGRSGIQVFKALVENKDGKWPWSIHHTWQSWRERYVKHTAEFDAHISRYQDKHNMNATETRKRASGATPVKEAKRAKLDVNVKEAGEEEQGSSGETHAGSQNTKPGTTSTSAPIYTPPHSSAHANPDHDTPEIPSLSQAPPQTDGELESSSPAKHAQRPCQTSSDVLDSDRPPPRRSPGVSVEDPQPAPSTSRVHADNGPVSTCLRAPPRIVDSFCGRVLVDQRGRVPREVVLKRAGERGEEIEEHEAERVEDKAQLPPPQNQIAEQKEASGQDVEVDPHHACGQSRPSPRPREVSHETGPTQTERKTHRGVKDVQQAAVAQEVADTHHQRATEVDQGYTIRNGASPIKRAVPPALEPPSAPVPASRLSKVLKFPVPRASTGSPFRSEPLTKQARDPIRPSLSRTKAARHPALARIPRQAVDDGKKNGQDERRRGPVPSVDLVALTNSSMSARSHSRSSTGTSGPSRPSRWSLPAYTHAWESTSASGPDTLFGREPSDLWGHARGRGSMRLLHTPSPARSTTAVATGTSGTTGAPLLAHSHTPPGPLSLRASPHASDIALTASHGLASLLAHMSANHGLALGVVEAVYAQVGSLSEADEVLKGMREAAEGFGEREIERRLRARQREKERRKRRKTGDGVVLRYVVASEDGEGEYSPPETSRAAMWKRRSGSEMSRTKERWDSGGEEEEAEGRAVEEELRDVEEEEEMSVSQDVTTLEACEEEERSELVTRALMEHKEARELQRRLGKERFRRGIGKLFVRDDKYDSII